MSTHAEDVPVLQEATDALTAVSPNMEARNGPKEAKRAVVLPEMQKVMNLRMRSRQGSGAAMAYSRNPIEAAVGRPVLNLPLKRER